MKICFPIEQNLGLASPVYGHFGSAPLFLIADPATKEFSVITNANLNHAHGMCMPVVALQGTQVDGVVLTGIGGGALSKLRAAGIEVYQAKPGTVEENLAAINDNALPLMQSTCGGHSHGHGGCGH